ncbi:MAG: DNA polymerase III subunit beta [Muribaculaceae bacterium]|nr:DNA polymerase III subunit beta [Muribaculaceae bacterium]
MKFNVSSQALYSITSSVSKIISSKNPIQILNSFLFTLEGDELTVKAADMENSLVGRIAVTEVDGEGSFCLDARRIVELLKLMPDQGLQVEVADNLEVTIQYSNGCYHTMAINGAEYPSANQNPDNGNNTLSFTAPAEVVLKGIENTIFAVSNEELRPQLTGILWDIKPDRIIFVSTDTRKLVRYTNSTITPNIECSFILPLKGASVLKNVFSKEESIRVTVSGVNVVFESATYTFDCRLIKGVFPDYNRVIPANNPYTLTVDRQLLLNAVRRVSVFGDEGLNLIKFKFAGGSLTLQACDQGYGTSGWESVPCDYSGADMMMGFASLYLLEILSTFSATDIVVKLADPSRPAICVPSESSADTELLMLLMPMTIVE